MQFAILLSGCVSFRAGGEIQHGRVALMYGDPNVALAHFQRAVEIAPDYRYDFSILSQGVWTYVGRAYYAAGKLPQARQALERAVSRYQDDSLARLYLGMVLARDGDRQRGLKEIGAAFGELQAWFDHLDRYHPYARFWDPGRQVRAEIQRSLAMVSGKEPNWQELIASGEWLGRVMEEEIDLSERQRRFEERRDGDDNDGNPN
ncbi:MAG: tetratricopeptide repeat protein [Deltaproteobacteria bacterium]|nr:tetratricopeptide repeat protein [Deltaproteobacteria bacterium]